jgi:hypothetical protein
LSGGSSDRCLELDPFNVVLAVLYALYRRRAKKVSRRLVHLAVYLFMRRLGYDCLEFT